MRSQVKKKSPAVQSVLDLEYSVARGLTRKPNSGIVYRSGDQFVFVFFVHLIAILGTRKRGRQQKNIKSYPVSDISKENQRTICHITFPPVKTVSTTVGH